ncbi:MAG: hypothetical protein ACI8PZ_002447 [Myxococcota bacterium]|jgi:hypothetical protein
MSLRTVVALALLLTACTEESSTEAAPDAEAVTTAELAEPAEPGLVIDLGSDADDSWIAVNDTVMGGVSVGDVVYTDSTLVFEGVVSTANNGGFASVRSASGEWDLSDFDTVLVRMRSQGQPFDLVMDDNMGWWDGEFRYALDTTDGEWVDLEIPLKDFGFHDFSTGYPEPTGERMRRPDRKNVATIQFMSALFEDGDFLLEVDHVAFR